MDRVAQAEAKKDAARHELVMARLETDAVNNAREQMEFELTGSNVPSPLQKVPG